MLQKQNGVPRRGILRRGSIELTGYLIAHGEAADLWYDTRQ